MNRYIDSTEGTLLFRMSAAADGYQIRNGKFEVRSRQGDERAFPTLLEAFIYYYTFDEEAELWDNTKTPVLIEKKVKLYLN